MEMEDFNYSKRCNREDDDEFYDNISQILVCHFDTIQMVVSVIYCQPNVPASSMQDFTKNSKQLIKYKTIRNISLAMPKSFLSKSILFP